MAEVFFQQETVEELREENQLEPTSIGSGIHTSRSSIFLQQLDL